MVLTQASQSMNKNLIFFFKYSIVNQVKNVTIHSNNKKTLLEKPPKNTLQGKVAHFANKSSKLLKRFIFMDMNKEKTPRGDRKQTQKAETKPESSSPYSLG